MPHRDDSEAARARADALARELEEVKAEREALKRENDELKNPKPAKKAEPERKPPTPETDDDAPPTRRHPDVAEDSGAMRKKILWGVLAVAAVGGFAGFIHNKNRTYELQREAYQQAVAERNALRDRWRPLVSFEPCVRDAELGEMMARRGAPTDWTDAVGYSFRAPDAKCSLDAKELAKDDAVPAPARDALSSWMAIDAELDAKSKDLNDYLSNADFKEDHFRSAPGRWSAVASILDRRRAVIATVVRDAFPALRTLIRGYQTAEEKKNGRSAAWWGIELGLEHWQIAEVGFQASGIRDGRQPDLQALAKAMRPAVEAWIKHSADAPIEVRRRVRQNDYWTDRAVDGNTRPDFAWDVNRTDNDPLAQITGDAPGLPPEPIAPPDDD